MGAELGDVGGPLGMAAGAALGANAVGLANMAFRNREAVERQDHFLDARSLNNPNASVRPIRPRFDRNTEPLRPQMESYGGEEVPSYHRMDTPSPPPWRPDDEAPGRRQDVMRPTAAARPQMPRMTAQRAVDESAAQQPAPEVLRLQRRAARNRLPPSASSSQGGPAGSYQDVLRATAAPTQGSSSSAATPFAATPFGVNAVAPLPARASNQPPQRVKRNRAPSA